MFQRSDLYKKVLNKGLCRGLSRVEQLVGVMCEANVAALEIPSVMAAAMDTQPDACQNDIVMVRGRNQRATASLLLRRGFPHIKALDYQYVCSGILRLRATQ